MKATKIILERRVENLEYDNAILVRKNRMLREEVNIINNLLKGSTALTIALEKTTEALAHTISDLKRR